MSKTENTRAKLDTLKDATALCVDAYTAVLDNVPTELEIHTFRLAQRFTTLEVELSVVSGSFSLPFTMTLDPLGRDASYFLWESETTEMCIKTNSAEEVARYLEERIHLRRNRT